jgi:hypothetical protein
MSRESDDTHKFTIDPLTGQLRAVVAFSRDAGKVFGFDVKATDRRGAEDGRYSIANVFVSIVNNYWVVWTFTKLPSLQTSIVNKIKLFEDILILLMKGNVNDTRGYRERE